MSDEVSDFLRSVELLKERREEEDEARSRDLEEQILQDKRERQARRAGNVSSHPSLSSSVSNPFPPSTTTSSTTATDTEANPSSPRQTPFCLEPSSVDLVVLPSLSYIITTYPPLLPFRD